jgi:[acyl-carrier-protein] S-malonyltransferase
MRALIFPGQGAQHTGMARDFAALARSEAFAFVEEALTEKMWRGTAEELAGTEITQPALYVAGVLAFEAFRRRWPAVVPDCVAGHSLGEITALACAGAVSYADGYRIAKTRARLMAAAPAGGMTAVIGLSRAALDDVLVSREVVVANQNSAQQFVLSGPRAALEDVERRLAAKAKRVQRLPISIAAHSPMMAGAVQPFAAFLQGVPFHDLDLDFINCADGRPLRSASELKAHLAAQLCRGVDWTQVALRLEARGVTRALEMGGDGKVAKLLTRTTPVVTHGAVHDLETLETQGEATP